MQKIASEEGKEYVLRTDLSDPGPSANRSVQAGVGQYLAGNTLTELLQQPGTAGGESNQSEPNGTGPQDSQPLNIEFDIPVETNSGDEDAFEWEDVPLPGTASQQGGNVFSAI